MLAAWLVHPGVLGALLEVAGERLEEGRRRSWVGARAYDAHQPGPGVGVEGVLGARVLERQVRLVACGHQALQ